MTRTVWITSLHDAFELNHQAFNIYYTRLASSGIRILSSCVKLFDTTDTYKSEVKREDIYSYTHITRT